MNLISQQKMTSSDALKFAVSCFAQAKPLLVIIVAWEQEVKEVFEYSVFENS